MNIFLESYATNQKAETMFDHLSSKPVSGRVRVKSSLFISDLIVLSNTSRYSLNFMISRSWENQNWLNRKNRQTKIKKDEHWLHMSCAWTIRW